MQRTQQGREGGGTESEWCQEGQAAAGQWPCVVAVAVQLPPTAADHRPAAAGVQHPQLVCRNRRAGALQPPTAANHHCRRRSTPSTPTGLPAHRPPTPTSTSPLATTTSPRTGEHWWTVHTHSHTHCPWSRPCAALVAVWCGPARKAQLMSWPVRPMQGFCAGFF